MEKDGTQDMTVLTADHILGPYTMVKGYRPYDMSSGDFDLAVDDQSGKAYYFFEKVHSELICAELDETYTGVGEIYSEHFKMDSLLM